MTETESGAAPGLPPPARLIAAVDATWPPAQTCHRAGWVLRRGAGGGQRVSAASPLAPGHAPDIATAEAAMRAWGQVPLFRLAEGEEAVDAALAAAGYAVHDPVVLYAAPVARLTDARDETARIIRVSTPLALAADIWAAGGIGPERRAVMARAAGARIALLARLGDRAAGCAFTACDGPVAMLHAMEVLAGFRRAGAGRQLLHGAANWAAEQGTEVLALAVTEANAPARALYEAAGMTVAARYHYRRLPEGSPT